MTYYAMIQAATYAIQLPFKCWSEFVRNNWPARPRLIAIWLGAGTIIDGIPTILLSSLKILPILVAGKWIDDDSLLAILASGL